MTSMLLHPVVSVRPHLLTCQQCFALSFERFLLLTSRTPLLFGSLLISLAALPQQVPLLLPSFFRLGFPGPQAPSLWSFGLKTKFISPFNVTALKLTQTKLLFPTHFIHLPSISPKSAPLWLPHFSLNSSFLFYIDLTPNPCRHL